MFLGLAVFLTLTLSLALLALRALKAFIRRLAGGRQPREPEARKEEKKKGGKNVQEPEKKAEAPAEDEGIRQEADSVSEEVRNRYAAAERDGITETFWTAPTDLALDGKTVADLSVMTSSLTYLEFNNRTLAGEDFFGFNLVVEEGRRLVLTYNGQALASITKVETRATTVVDGREVEGTQTAYRVNTFPPTLSPSMAVSDLESMLTAVDAVKACGGDPRLAADAMLSEFTDPRNISKLKGSIDRKIQSKELPREEAQARSRKRGARRLA